MGAIYHGAESVVISLDDADGDARHIAKYCHLLATEKAGYPSDQPQPAPPMDLMKDDRDLKAGKALVVKTDINRIFMIAQAVERFSSKPYWSRVWIIQELKLARRIRIICGMLLIDKDELDALTRTLFLDTLTSKFGLQWKALRGFPSLLGRPMPQTSLAIDRSHNSRLVNEINFITKLGCTDPRDRIYGMLHVFQWNIYGPPDVDYARSSHQLAVDFLNRVKYDV